MKEVSAEFKKTKTERFVEMVDGLEVGGTGVIVELGDTHHQTFRVLVTRYYTSNGHSNVCAFLWTAIASSTEIFMRKARGAVKIPEG